MSWLRRDKSPATDADGDTLDDIALEDEVLRCYPAFARLPRPRAWDAYLPPLTPGLEAVLEQA